MQGCAVKVEDVRPTIGKRTGDQRWVSSTEYENFVKQVGAVAKYS